MTFLDPQNPEEVLSRCAQDFEYFCDNFAKIEDKASHAPLAFDMYPCQRETARQLVAGEWLWILKARQLGFTWLLAVYTTWLITFKERRLVIVLNQDLDYAQDFIERVRFVYENLPYEMQQTIGTNNKKRMQFLDTGGVVRVVAASVKAARSTSADLVIFDEAALIEAQRTGILKAARSAASPALERGKGQIVALSTSQGPRGDFHDTFNEAQAGGTRYRAVFYPWNALPDRTPEWYAKEAKDHESDPLYMPREFPASPEEAFQSAEGRVYPLLVSGPKFITKLELQPSWKRYRAIDWGGTDPFTCLWGALVPGDGPGLTIDPDCKNTIKELLGYSYEDGKPQDHANHACDALRYMVITPGNDGVKGHLHIYRELYEPNSAARGFGVDDMARRITAMTGTESIELTVADVSRPDNIRTYFNLGMKEIRPQRKLGGDRVGEIEQGITQVNALVVAQSKSKAVAIPGTTFPKLPQGFNPTKVQSAAVAKRPAVFT